GDCEIVLEAGFRVRSQELAPRNDAAYSSPRHSGMRLLGADPESRSHTVLLDSGFARKSSRPGMTRHIVHPIIPGCASWAQTRNPATGSGFRVRSQELAPRNDSEA